MPTLQTRFYEWQQSYPEAKFVKTWRSPGRTKALITTYFGGLVLAAASTFLGFLSLKFLWATYLFLLISMVSWTILRNTIHMKDLAPREALDSYEQVILDIWRARTLTVLNFLLIAGGVAAIVLGVSWGEHISTQLFAAITGSYLIYIYLTVQSLPAVGYALTFNRPAED